MSASTVRLAETALALEAESVRRSMAASLVRSGASVLRYTDDAFLVKGEFELMLLRAGWARDDAFGPCSYVHPAGGVATFSEVPAIQGMSGRTRRSLGEALWADAITSGDGWQTPGPAGSAKLLSLPAPRPSGALRESLQLRRQGFGLTGYPRRRIGFFGNRLVVPRGVYPPKAVTEEVVRKALAAIGDRRSPTIVDVASGSGAIGVSIARARPDARVIAVDTSGRAVRAIRRNARRLRVRVAVEQGSLLEPVVGSFRAHVICANVPYVPPWRASDPAYKAPRSCVAGTDPDGLGFVRELIRDARGKLEPGGALILQVADAQWDVVRACLEDAGYSPEDPARRVVGYAVVASAVWSGIQ